MFGYNKKLGDKFTIVIENKDDEITLEANVLVEFHVTVGRGNSVDLREKEVKVKKIVIQIKEDEVSKAYRKSKLVKE